MLFIIVALFGLLSAAILKGTSGNLLWFSKEKTSALSVSSDECGMALATALKRLQARGCGKKISYLTDGSNLAPNAPRDGSCSIYHPNGGGAKICSASNAGAACGTLIVGNACDNGTIYAGVSPDTANALIITPSDAPAKYKWDEAVAFCNSFTGSGYNDWRLPSAAEAGKIQDGWGHIGGLSNSYYWSGDVVNAATSVAVAMANGATQNTAVQTLNAVRCVRSDP